MQELNIKLKNIIPLEYKTVFKLGGLFLKKKMEYKMGLFVLIVWTILLIFFLKEKQ